MIELFKAADKYDVLGLVQECVASFRQLTGAEEVAPLLQVTYPFVSVGFCLIHLLVLIRSAGRPQLAAVNLPLYLHNVMVRKAGDGQVAAERHSEELRSVCVDVAAQCLPDVLVMHCLLFFPLPD